MRTQSLKIFIFATVMLFFSLSCKDTPKPIADGDKATIEKQPILDKKNNDPKQVKADPKQAATKNVATSFKKPDCSIKGKTMEDNDLWLERSGQRIFMVADESTKSPNFGESYRVLQAYDATCNKIFNTTLPVNRSPDFPYYISKNGYNSRLGILAIQGYDKVFCYDVNNKKLLPVLEVEYINMNNAADASSGTPMGINTWANYIIGYARDFGPYGFDMTNTKQPKPIAPFAIWTEDYLDYPLYLLSRKDGKYQAFMPKLDQDGAMDINPLFKNPINLKPTQSKEKKANLEFKDLDTGKSYTIDLKNQKLK